MDYSKLSDAEINLAVAAIQFPQSERNTPYYHRPDTYIYHRNGTHEAKDYCNNPEDAWPIIVGNKICLSCKPNRNDWDAFTLSDKGYAEEATYDASPLRAAMIVFLMMQEGE